MDATHIRAHQHARELKNQAHSKHIGGNRSKIHLAVYSNGIQCSF